MNEEHLIGLEDYEGEMKDAKSALSAKKVRKYIADRGTASNFDVCLKFGRKQGSDALEWLMVRGFIKESPMGSFKVVPL